MKHHKTKGMTAIKTKEELLREVNRIAQQCLLKAEDKHSWLLDLEAAADAEMGCTKVQYSIFELEALLAQEKLIAKRTGGKTTSWAEYCRMCGEGVPVDNHMEGEGSLLEEEEEEADTKQPKKKAKTPSKQVETVKPQEPKPRTKQSGKPAKKQRKRPKTGEKISQSENFLRNEPSPGAATRDTIGIISCGVTPRDTGQIMTKLLNRRLRQREGSELVAARTSPGGGWKR